MECNFPNSIVANKYCCEVCDYITSRKSSYNKHTQTIKHISCIKRNFIAKGANKHICICGKQYAHMSSLCNHKRSCKKPVVNHVKTIVNTLNNVDELKNFLIEQNNEFKDLLVEQNKQIIELSSKPTTTNNTTNNNFNLQFFLNETCKDALNITDFINQLDVGTKDLEETGRIGYAAGISRIFINGLKKLNINQRPVHCSDAKRETIYIKNGGQWEKDNYENVKLTNAIRDVAHKNIEQIQVWTEEHPEYTDLKSKFNDRYMKLIGEAMSGSTNEETNKNYKKIARNIMKATIISK